MKIEKQEIAYIYASYLLQAKSDRKAAKEFSRIPNKNTSRRQRKKFALEYIRQKRQDRANEIEIFDAEKLDKIREDLAAIDNEYLEKKKNNFSMVDRTLLVLRAKGGQFSGMTKEERVHMYKAAGYTEDEILKITGKKLLFSAGISTSLALTSRGTQVLTTFNEKIIPFINQIPDNKSWLAVGTALTINAASFALLTERNLRLTQGIGISTNSTVTGLYLLGNRLFPDKARDSIAVGLPITYNIANNVIYSGAVGAITENADKVIAASTTGTTFNLLLAATCTAWLEYKRRKH